MIEINVDATAFGTSGCVLNFKRTVVGEFDYSFNYEGSDGITPQISIPPEGGYKDKLLTIDIVYGICVHKYIDVMYKTNGFIPLARKKALHLFQTIPYESISDRKAHLGDSIHLLTTCFNVWEDYIKLNNSFQPLELPVECAWCDGTGMITESHHVPDMEMDGLTMSKVSCKHCNGTKVIQGPATEINFKLPFYSVLVGQTVVQFNICGTIDRIGKKSGGPYMIRDWKTTGSFNSPDEYLYQYWLSRQLRMYLLALKLEHELHPESVLGKIGGTRVGACIDAIFLKKNANDNIYKESDVMMFDEADIKEFRDELVDFCDDFAHRIPTNNFPRQGILNGSCMGNYGKLCKFFPICKTGGGVGKMMLARDFVRKPYDPLNFHE